MKLMSAKPAVLGLFFVVLLTAIVSTAAVPKGMYFGIEAGPMSQVSERSRLQPFFAMNVGYDVSRLFALGGLFGQGFANNNSAPAYSMTLADVGGIFNFEIIDWLEFTTSVMAGGGLISPGPNYESNEWSVNGRVAVGLRYYTLIAGLSVGADISYMGTCMLKSARFLSALSLTPQLKYVF